VREVNLKQAFDMRHFEEIGAVQVVQFSEEVVERRCGVQHRFVVQVEERFDAVWVCCGETMSTVG
jgi:hypothetical protein